MKSPLSRTHQMTRYPKQRRKVGICECGAPATIKFADSVVCKRCYELAHSINGHGRRVIEVKR